MPWEVHHHLLLLLLVVVVLLLLLVLVLVKDYRHLLATLSFYLPNTPT